MELLFSFIFSREIITSCAFFNFKIQVSVKSRSINVLRFGLALEKLMG